MKVNVIKTICYSLFAAALVAAPAPTFAADGTNPPAAITPKPGRVLPFHGKVAAVDTNAMTFTVGSTTLAISSETRIFKEGKPAVFEELAAGQVVSGAYKKDDSGKATATLIRVRTAKQSPMPAPAPESK